MGLISSWNKIKDVFKQDDGSFFYQIWSSNTNYGEHRRLESILKNPAALFVFLLLPELYSMGKYRLYDSNENEIERHPILDLLRNPNPMQTGDQFKWDYMFWRKLGTANLYIDSQVLSERNKLYFLSPDCIEWPKWFSDNSQTLFLSDTSVRELYEKELKYKTANQTITFKYKKLKQFFDLSNGINSWFSSPSRVDAIYKIIKNSDNALDSKNINSKFASKFIVAGKASIENTSQLPMSEQDKESVQDRMLGKQSVFPMKSMVDIKRFIENAQVLEHLDKSFMNDAFILGKMLNIPKDVIEMLGEGSTYENQEKARAAIISYCIQPDADDFCSGMLQYFKLEGYKLELDYSHLPFVQAFEKDRSEVKARLAKAFLDLVNAGANQQQAADELGFEYLTEFGPRNESQGQTGEGNLKKVV